VRAPATHCEGAACSRAGAAHLLHDADTLTTTSTNERCESIVISFDVMTIPVAKRLFTIEEYLRFEETAVGRHEFHDGEILAMSGGTYEHSLINVNFTSSLKARLKDRPCRVTESNLRIRIGASSKYVYPDASVICGQPAFDLADPKRTTVLNPRVIIEVLSESTESYDRSAKFMLYRMVETHEEYVLISTHRPLVETFRRQTDGSWMIGPYFEGVDAVAELKALSIELPLAEVYDGITFPPLPPEPERS
jgi:Uma2 family endonuclease